jgi:hypothetical protein
MPAVTKGPDPNYSPRDFTQPARAAKPSKS